MKHAPPERASLVLVPFKEIHNILESSFFFVRTMSGVALLWNNKDDSHILVGCCLKSLRFHILSPVYSSYPLI